MGKYISDSVYEVDENKTILWHIHIPRTGGQYLAQYKSGKNTIVDNTIHLGHVYVIENKSDFPANPIFPDNRFVGFHGIVPLEMFVKNNIIFSVIRNVFDLLVSIYTYWNKDNDINNFRTWLVNTTNNTEYEWPNRRFLHTQLFTDRGSWFCDWICRTETLDDDLKAMAKYYDLDYTPNKPRENISNKKDYREYYTDKLVDLVYNIWGREIGIFGYEFDNVMYNTDNEFHRLISDETRGKCRYVYKNNILIIEGPS